MSTTPCDICGGPEALLMADGLWRCSACMMRQPRRAHRDHCLWCAARTSDPPRQHETRCPRWRRWAQEPVRW